MKNVKSNICLKKSLTRTNVCDKLISDEGEVRNMKDIFKSKAMLGFILFIMGVCFINNMCDVRMQSEPSNNDIAYVSK